MDKTVNFMARAIALAEQAKNEDEVPVAAVVVVNNIIIAAASNATRKSCSPTAHAEILALEQAALAINNFRLTQASIYITLEPCIMCYGAMIQARIKNCIYAASDKKSGVISCGIVDTSKHAVNHSINFYQGSHKMESEKMLKHFFQQKRTLKSGKKDDSLLFRRSLTTEE